MHAEYLAVRAFGWSHDQYLDTPSHVTAWLLHIDREVKQHEAEQKAAANRG